MDRIGNEDIRGTSHVKQFGEQVKEARLRKFGHKRNSEYIGQSILSRELEVG